MNRQRITRLVVGLGALALAAPAAAQGVAVGVGAAASVTSRQGVAVVRHGGGYVSLDRLVSPHLSVGGELGLVHGARASWESQARVRVRFTVGAGPVRPYVQYGVGLGRRHTTPQAAAAVTSTVAYSGPGGGVLLAIGTTPWALQAGMDLSGPRAGGFTATEDLRVALGVVRRWP